MEPFRVKIELETPMVEPRQLFHLDALLSAMRVEQAENEGGPIEPRSIHHDLPLERYRSPSDEWCFKASAFKLHREIEPFTWMMTGRADLEAAAIDRDEGLLKFRVAAPNTAGGPFKSSKFSIDLTWCWLEAWGVGDLARVRSLLDLCVYVGGRRGTAFGRVGRIDIDPVPLGECLWYLRTLPIDANVQPTHTMVRSIGHLRAPYWDRTEHREVLVPLI